MSEAFGFELEVGTDRRNARGSQWHRWDPHIHAPGTILNNQYQGVQAWEEFLDRVEASKPPMRVLGITDYYSLATYTAVLGKKAEGRLSKVDLIFPNVEMRYGVGTFRGAAINLHLLVSPEDPDHVAKVQRFLHSLTFQVGDESYRCDAPDLIRLGRMHDKEAISDQAALAAGTNQFKVNPDQFWNEWKRSTWIQENALLAVAVGSGDGTSGLQGDSSLAALRKELERRAHIIFSSQPKQREFWLGRGAVPLDELKSGWKGPKPCLHGSDAHSTAGVGKPSLSRYCWIKGDLSFESLRQVCLEPDARTSVGPSVPRGAMPSKVITGVNVTQAPWLKTTPVPLNGGLVGIIGARGSGKTALADIIAAGGFSCASHMNDRSFIRRAKKYLLNAQAQLTWEDGDPTASELSAAEYDDFLDAPKVRYLSQQFVDQLCSAEGMTDELLAEMERVIYQAHPHEDRLGTTTFRELLEIRTASARSQRENRDASLAHINHELSVERERKASLPVLRHQREERSAAIVKGKRDRTSVMSKGGEERVKRLDQVSTAAEQVRFQIEQTRRQRQMLLALRKEVEETRTSKSPQRLRQLQQTYAEAGLTVENWRSFLLVFEGDVDAILGTAIRGVEDRIKKLAGPATGEVVLSVDSTPSSTSLLPTNCILVRQTLSLLDKEVTRLRGLIGIDSENSKLLSRLSEKITRDEAGLAKLDREIDLANKADGRIKELLLSRSASYAAVFEGIVEEETELSSLYQPLKERLNVENGALGKLSFSVRRIVDVESWAEQGEKLIDNRKAGPFRGRGALLEVAKACLLDAWQSGSSVEVAEAMVKFRESHERSLMDHALVDRSNAEAYRHWAADISAWLYGTSHISVAYGVQYEGVDIEQLSPGTRGIVLLLLYLAMDLDDDRPLLIDQPEENLDPKSIFDELVERFRRAKQRRQIIIVTHNANLIVNTDADQVIVASCGPHRAGQLPEMSYQSGGLENPEIRRRVCEILEGGENAFKERARRLRVRL